MTATDLIQLIKLFGDYGGFPGIAFMVLALVFFATVRQYKKDVAILNETHALEIKTIHTEYATELRELHTAHEKVLSDQNSRYAEQVSRTLSIIENNTSAVRGLHDTQRTLIQLVATIMQKA